MATEIQKYTFMILRGLTGFIFFMHGIARIYYWTIPSFGEYLNTLGFLIGLQLAWLITVGEIVCGSMLAIGYKVKYSAIYSNGFFTKVGFRFKLQKTIMQIIYADIDLSLDGFIAGLDISIENPLGVGGENLI